MWAGLGGGGEAPAGVGDPRRGCRPGSGWLGAGCGAAGSGPSLWLSPKRGAEKAQPCHCSPGSFLPEGPSAGFHLVSFFPSFPKKLQPSPPPVTGPLHLPGLWRSQGQRVWNLFIFHTVVLRGLGWTQGSAQRGCWTRRRPGACRRVSRSPGIFPAAHSSVEVRLLRSLPTLSRTSATESWALWSCHSGPWF